MHLTTATTRLIVINERPIPPGGAFDWATMRSELLCRRCGHTLAEHNNPAVAKCAADGCNCVTFNYPEANDGTWTKWRQRLAETFGDPLGKHEPGGDGSVDESAADREDQCPSAGQPQAQGEEGQGAEGTEAKEA